MVDGLAETQREKERLEKNCFLSHKCSLKFSSLGVTSKLLAVMKFG